MLIVTKHSTKYSKTNGTIPVFHYLILYFHYFKHQNIYISTYLYFLQLSSLYFFNNLNLKGVCNAKRTITIQKSLYGIKKYLYIRRKFNHNNNDFKRDWHNRNESNRAGKIQLI